MLPGHKVWLIANLGRVGIVGPETDGSAHSQRLLVNCLDGDTSSLSLPDPWKKSRKRQLAPINSWPMVATDVRL